MHGRRLLVLALAAALAACQPGPAGVKPTKPTGSAGPRAGASPAIAATVAPAAGAGKGGVGLVSDVGGGLVANNGAGLAGVVRAPASLITDNGAGLITDNGAGIVSDGGGSLVGNNSASYALAAAPAQAPVRGVAVVLLDAAGQPAKDAQGLPLRAVTGADGAFAFPVVAADRTLVAAVELPGGKGTLQALVAKEADPRKRVEVDLVSTLTTRYILDRFVTPQAEPLAVLERLPAAVEAETRASAAAALGASDAALPAALTREAAVAAVEALRAGNPAFDAQLEAVKRLLVVAGQSELGAGGVATEVVLGDVTGLAAGADGAVYVACGKDYRIWRVGTDGKLVAFAGTGKRDLAATLGGQRALEAGLAFPRMLTLDAAGRPLFLDGPTDVTLYKTPPRSRLNRILADGALQDAWPALGEGLAAFPGTGDEVFVVHGTAPVVHSRVAADGQVQDLQALPDAAARLLARGRAYGRDAAGRLYVGAVDDDGARVYRLDPATGEPAVIAQEGQAGVLTLSLAADGRVALVEAEGAGRRLVALAPDGGRTVLAPALPADFELLRLAPVAFAPDGALLHTRRGNQVHRVAPGGTATHVAGRAERLGANATDVALVSPAGLVAGDDGTLWFADKYAHRVYRRDPAGVVTAIAGIGGGNADGVGTSAGDGGPATAASLDRPRALRRDGAGAFYVLEAGVRVRKIDAGGVISRHFRAPTDLSIRDFVMAADGAAYYSYKGHGDGPCSVTMVKPDGTTVPVLPPAAIRGTVVGLGPDGKLYLLSADAAGRKLLAWTEAGGLVTLDEALPFDVNMPNDSNGLAVDGRGRVIITSYNDDVVRLWDPATKAVTTIAGEGGRHYAGSGVDNSLSSPRYPALAGNGDLYLSDTQHKQVKRIPAGEY